MHDLLTAKEIINKVIKNANDNKLKKVKKVVIELGQKKYAHGSTSLTTGGGHEHMSAQGGPASGWEEINPENLEFNLKLFAKNTIAENAKFIIKKPARFALRSKAGGSDKPDILVKEIEGE